MGSQRIKNPLGVIQGRLLPKYKDRYQAHPVGYWQDEFPKASKLGLDCIEFIFDFNNSQQNPLLTQEGRRQINFVSRNSGVKVYSICADYFMESPLHSENRKTSESSILVLKQLLDAAGELEISDIVIPCVDHSSLQNERKRDRFQELLSCVIHDAERNEVNLALETNLNPFQFATLLDRLDSPRVTVNYDIGNSASLGYNPAEELSAYGERISDIHIKDRTLGGGPVILGTGNADIPGFFTLLERFNYDGPYIMQVYRDDEGYSIFKEQLDWLLTQGLKLE